MEVKINIVEAASELADERVKENFRKACIIVTKYNPSPEQLEELVYQEDENGDIVYKPEAQEVFNNYYDVFYDMLLKCKSNDGLLFKNEFQLSDTTLENTRFSLEGIKETHTDNMINHLRDLIIKNYEVKEIKNGKQFSVEFILNFKKNDKI